MQLARIVVELHGKLPEERCTDMAECGAMQRLRRADRLAAGLIRTDSTCGIFPISSTLVPPIPPTKRLSVIENIVGCLL